MNWIVKIENEPLLRIVVIFKPLEELLVFNGEHKIKNNEWRKFYFEEHKIDAGLLKIEEILLNTYNNLNDKVRCYENLMEIFNSIKLIEIKKD